MTRVLRDLPMTTDTEESAKPLPAVRVRWWLLALGVVPFVGTDFSQGV